MNAGWSARPASTWRSTTSVKLSVSGISASSSPNDDRLRVRVEVERLRAVLLAVAAGLQPAERQLVVDLRARVDPGVTAVELGRGAFGAIQVARPHGGAQAERRVVGQR